MAKKTQICKVIRDTLPRKSKLNFYLHFIPLVPSLCQDKKEIKRKKTTKTNKKPKHQPDSIYMEETPIKEVNDTIKLEIQTNNIDVNIIANDQGILATIKKIPQTQQQPIILTPKLKNNTKKLTPRLKCKPKVFKGKSQDQKSNTLFNSIEDYFI